MLGGHKPQTKRNRLANMQNGKSIGPKGSFDLTGLMLVACLCLACQKVPVVSLGEPQEASTDVATDPIEEPDVRLPVDETKVLGTWVTEYNFKSERSRAHNIELAASKVHGVDLQPGERFSFNQHVGVRSKENGFQEAGVLFMGMHDSDVGGGTCQVASTVHASALMAGMTIVSRTPHSRFSAYIAPGLDATVVYPPECLQKCLYSADLVLSNPYPVPIGIRVQVLEPEPKKTKRRLQVQFVGLESNFEVTYTFKSRPFGEPDRITKVNENISDPTYSKRVQKSTSGYKLVSLVKYASDAGLHFFEYQSEYQPVDEVWEVGEGYDGGNPWETLQGDSGADGGLSEAGSETGSD